VLTDRWTLLIAREMLAGAGHFNQLERGLPGISRTLLAQRIEWLERAGVVGRYRRADGKTAEYQLTRAGRELQRVVDVLGTWGARWAFGEIRPSELDPVLLLWMVRRRIRRRQLPGGRRIVVEFRFPGSQPEWLWLVLDRTDVSLCLKHPGFQPDVRIRADLTVFYYAWLGRITLPEAIRSGAVQIEGDQRLTRSFSGWLQWSPMANAVRAAVAEGLPAAEGLERARRIHARKRRMRSRPENEPVVAPA
jgi:DNA-binding HxlR family transcriptional regulator